MVVGYEEGNETTQFASRKNCKVALLSLDQCRNAPGKLEHRGDKGHLATVSYTLASHCCADDFRCTATVVSKPSECPSPSLALPSSGIVVPCRRTALSARRRSFSWRRSWARSCGRPERCSICRSKESIYSCCLWRAALCARRSVALFLFNLATALSSGPSEAVCGSSSIAAIRNDRYAGRYSDKAVTCWHRSPRWGEELSLIS